jgi:hypothetical protein
MEETFYCLVVGSRTFENYNLMKNKLDKLLVNQKNVVIVSGGARGADSLAEKYAKEKGYTLKIFKADWKKWGNYAGYERNNRMHEYIKDYEKRGCVAFWDGKSHGTKQNFDLCEKYNTPLRIIKF